MGVTKTEFKDALLRPLAVGDYVMTTISWVGLHQVVKFTPKMVVCRTVGKKQLNNRHFYSETLVRVPEEDVMLYLLQQENQ